MIFVWQSEKNYSTLISHEYGGTHQQPLNLSTLDTLQSHNNQNQKMAHSLHKVFTVITSLIICLNAYAYGFEANYDFEVNGLCYSIISDEDKTVELSAPTSRDISGELLIPQSVTNGVTTYSITMIGKRALYSCKNLTSIALPNSITYIDEYAFSGCEGITSMTIPNSVKYLGEGAFNRCLGLKSVDIPNSVLFLGELCFEGCGLTSVVIPNSLTSTGDGAFEFCENLTSVTLPNSITLIDGSFSHCTSLTSIEIPNSVTCIGDFAFHGCKNLQDINIPNSVTSIEYMAFAACESLTSITIPNSVDKIGKDVFESCSNLKYITLSSKISSIGYGTFKWCDKIKEIYCQATVPPTFNSEDKGFESRVYAGACLYVPTGCSESYRKSDIWKLFLNIKEMDFSGIEDVNSNTNPSIAVNNGTIVVNGYAGEVEVFTTSGQLIYKGNDTCISNLNKGIYIVKTGTNVTKVAL